MLLERYGALREAIGKVIVGQEEVVRLLSVGMFAGGHMLVIGVPGLAKTLMVKALAQSLGWEFRRIQFTPDLMPADITGTEILQVTEGSAERTLVFRKGPVFANLILADEINRTPSKTQAALQRHDDGDVGVVPQIHFRRT
jgi:MoxR-like ATPase